MANGSGTGKVTVPGAVLGGLLGVLILISIWLFATDRYWFTPLASIHGAAIDRVFVVVLIVTGIAFVATQGLLALFVTRYGENGGERASYWHDNPKAEAILIGVTALTLTVLVFMGQFVWADIYFADPPENALQVEVTGQQFQWVFRYPGPDGEFGDVNPMLIVPGVNDIGLVRDGAGADDIVSQVMHAVQDQPVHFFLRSTDVIHDFHIPHMRVKQDVVPGLVVEGWFTPTIAGEYEVACAELCGINHYSMKRTFIVDSSQEEFDAWLEEQLEFQ
jgi:cytochrome c oxidase subunit 2